MAKYLVPFNRFVNDLFINQCIHAIPKRYRYQTNVEPRKFLYAVKENGEHYQYNQQAYAKLQKRDTIAALQHYLKLNNISAVEVADRWKDVYKLPIMQISENMKILKANKINDLMIIKYPFLLGAENVDKKVELLKQLPYKINETAPLLKYTTKSLFKFVSNELELMKEPCGGRIDFLCRIFKCAPDIACNIFMHYKFLIRYSYARLERNMEILYKYGITLDAIKKDCWVLAYSPELIESRMEKAKESQVVELKTWMVRCSTNIMNKCIQRKQSNKSILGSNSPADYLSERLECTLEEAQMIIVRNKPLGTKSIVRLKEILDWLYSEGFQPYQIQRVPRILLHSFETIKGRVKCLRDLDYNIDSLVYLLKSKRDFQKYLETLELKKKKKQQQQQQQQQSINL